MSCGPIWVPVRDVPEGRDGLEAGDGEGPAIRAELEGKRSVAALVELVDELPGADVPEAYDSAETTDREHLAIGAECDGEVSDWRAVDGGDRRACGHIPNLRASLAWAGKRDRRPVSAEGEVARASHRFRSSPRLAPVAASQSFTPSWLLAVESVAPSGLKPTPTSESPRARAERPMEPRSRTNVPECQRAAEGHGGERLPIR